MEQLSSEWICWKEKSIRSAVFSLLWVPHRLKKISLYGCGWKKVNDLDRTK
jgi:hypothetical protein